MTAAPLARTGFKFMMAVREGPDKGAAFQLLPPRVTIGRGQDNNVALRDPRMSRRSAVIEFSLEKINIIDVSGRASLHVNGQNAVETTLKNGDVLRIGETEMIFVVEAIPLAPQPPRAHGQPGAVVPFPTSHAPGLPPIAHTPHMPPPGGTGNAGSPHGNPRAAQASRQGAPGSGNRMRFYTIVGVVLALLGWLLTQETPKKPKEEGIRTVEEIEKEIKGSEERLEQIVQKRTFKSQEEKTRYEEAQKHYLLGFRDFQKGQWLRAMRAFETARAIDPEHELARRYYRLAEKHRDEMISQMMMEGRRYREKSMFTRCSSALEKVLEELPNKDDVKYKQAEALKKECDLLLEERFR